MKIYNQDKTQELKTYDFKAGKLVKDKRVSKHIEAVQEVKGKTALEVYEERKAAGEDVEIIGGEPYLVTKRYLNEDGTEKGKTVEEIEAVVAVAAQEAYDEYEDIYVFIPYTEEERLEVQKDDLRNRREAECYSVINRGELWYSMLTEEQKTELKAWYIAWLNVTDTLVVPETPAFLVEKERARKSA